MSKIQIKTRKVKAFEEWSAMREILISRETFQVDEVQEVLRKLLGREITQERVQTMIWSLYRRQKIIRPIGTKAGQGVHQTYEVLNKDIHISPPKNIEIKPKFSLLPPLIDEELRKKKEEREKKEVEILTLADIERIGEMDLAFIGYTIRTENEILSKKYEESLIQVKKAQEQITTLFEENEEMKKNHMAEIQTLVKHHKQEIESFKKIEEVSKNQVQTIKNLNDRIVNLNSVNINLVKDVERLEKIVGKTQRGDKTFKLGEVAKFTNGKPSHLS